MNKIERPLAVSDLFLASSSPPSSQNNIDFFSQSIKRGSHHHVEKPFKKFILAKEIKKYESEYDQKQFEMEAQQQKQDEKRRSTITTDKTKPIQIEKKSLKGNDLPSQGGYLDKASYFSLEKKQDKEKDLLEQPMMRKSLMSINSLNQNEEEILREKNIFLEKNNPIDKQLYKEFNIGPRTDKEGKIIQYTLVGNTAWFSKQKEIVDKNVKSKMQGRDSLKNKEGTIEQQLQKPKNYFHLKNQSPISSKNQMQTSINLMDKSSGTTRPDSTQSGTVKAQQIKKKKKADKCLEISRDDIIKEFSDLEKRHAISLHAEEKVVNSMSLEQKNIFTRNERVMKSYENHVSDWDKTIKIVTQHSDRPPQTSCMLRGDSHRRKIEYSLAFDSLKTDEEIYGKRIWYMNLRKYPNEQKKEDDFPIIQKRQSLNQVTFDTINGSLSERNSRHKRSRFSENITSDIFSGFNSVAVNSQNKEIEVIRKPQDPAHFHLSSSTGFSAFTKYSSLNYIEGQVREQTNKLKNKMIVLDNPVDDLFVQGSSKLQAEKLSLLNSMNSKTFTKLIQLESQYEKDQPISIRGGTSSNNTPKGQSYFPSQKLMQSNAPVPQKTEVIDEDYDIYQLSRQGRHFYPSIIQKLEVAESKTTRQ